MAKMNVGKWRLAKVGNLEKYMQSWREKAVKLFRYFGEKNKKM